MRPGYVELHLHTCYSLLEGASRPEELVDRAAEYGYGTLAVTDRNNLHGAMVFARRCRERGIRPIIGVELTIAAERGESSGPRHDLTLLASTRTGYANLCRLTSMANGWRAGSQAARERRRRDPCLHREELAAHAEGVVCLTGGRRGELAVLVSSGDLAGAASVLRRWMEWFGPTNVWVELHDNLVQGDRPRNRALAKLAKQVGVGVVATGDVHYHERSRHRLHDALCAIRHRTTLDGCHEQRRPNNEFFLRPPGEQAERFAEWPDAVANTVRVAERCGFDLTEDLGYRLPAPPVPGGHTQESWLQALCAEKLEQRYRDVPPERRELARARLAEELELIGRHGLAGFFLVYHEVLGLATEVAREVRGRAPRGRVNLPPGRGRGSSVSSIVCYLIGLSHVDPIEARLAVGRFLPDGELDHLPDIDLDFPRDIRDRLFQRVYERWGTERAALVATFPTYRIRSAVRDLGKALGLPGVEIDRLAKAAEGYGSAKGVRQEMERLPQFQPLVEAAGWQHLIELAGELAGFPRHVSQHVGGMIIASEPLIDCVPVQPAAWPGRYVCQWDKDDIDDARMVKIDFLALGMLSLVEECLDLCAHHQGELVDLSRIPLDDTTVYDRIGRGDTVGVFQIESRAQASILPTTRPRSIEDLTAQVAIIRPGPIVGGAVSSYREHRQHGTAPDLHPTVRDILGETFGVVLYQEQVVQVAVAMGGFTTGEAETFRRAMGRKDWPDRQAGYRHKFLTGAHRRRVALQVAEQMFEKLTGFAQFGFPKSHAAAFAILAYQSAWLREHHTVEFYCALFNNWPMGFYPPHVFTNDARRHGVEVRRPAINDSQPACTITEDGAIRLGLTWVRGIGTAAATAIAEERDRAGPYRSLWDFVARTGLAGEPIENVIRAGAFDHLGLPTRRLLWQLWLFGHNPGTPSPPGEPPGRGRQLQLDLFSHHHDDVELPEPTAFDTMADDYQILGLSPQAHPMHFLRDRLPAVYRTSQQLCAIPVGDRANIAGLVVCRQRPGTARGAVYLLLEDEHGLINVVLPPRLYEQRRPVIRTSPFLRIHGSIDAHAGDVATLRAHTIQPLRPSETLRAPDGKSWT